MHAALMKMYRTANVDTPKHFRAELSQSVSGIMSTIVQDIQNRGGKCEIVKSPLSFPIYV